MDRTQSARELSENPGRAGFLSWIHEPPDITAGMWGFYLAMLSLSTLTYILPPRTVSEYMGAHVTWLWPSLWGFGALIGVLVTLQGWFIFERVAIVFIFGGSLLYLAATLEAQFASDGGNRWGHLTAIIIGIWFLWYRFRTIYLHDLNPAKA